MDHAADAHFRKSQSGRLVFFPFTSRGKAYFVESKSDEEKIRSFVKIFRSSFTLIFLLSYPSLLVPALILEDYAGLTPKGHRLTIALGIPLFFWLVLGTLAWMLWGVYREAVPGLTASLSEVGPDLKRQLREASPLRLRALLGLSSGLVILAAAILAAMHYSQQ
jgi:hypothetical protein